MFNLFKRKTKVDKTIEPGKESQTILSEAIHLGMIERNSDEFTITEYGYSNGCYRTKAGGIGFSARGVALLLNRKKVGNQRA